MRWMGWFRRKPRTTVEPVASASSVTGFIHGRERVRGVPYLLPADMEEVNRLDFQHYLLRHAFEGNFAAPVGHPRDILDVGTGTGRWAIEMAQAYPEANVIGLDVKPPAVDERAARRPGQDQRPPNYAFVPGNVLEGLPFPDGAFDYVHQRLLFSAIPHDRWPAVATELARVTRPGGWVELIETIGYINGGPHVDQLMAWGTEISLRRGVDITDGGRIGEYLRGAGLNAIVTRRFDLPTGSFGGRLGTLMAADFVSLYKAYGGIAAAQGVTTQERWDQALAAAQADLNASVYKCVIPFFIAYGQRQG